MPDIEKYLIEFLQKVYTPEMTDETLVTLLYQKILYSNDSATDIKAYDLIGFLAENYSQSKNEIDIETFRISFYSDEAFAKGVLASYINNHRPQNDNNFADAMFLPDIIRAMLKELINLSPSSAKIVLNGILTGYIEIVRVNEYYKQILDHLLCYRHYVKKIIVSDVREYLYLNPSEPNSKEILEFLTADVDDLLNYDGTYLYSLFNNYLDIFIRILMNNLLGDNLDKLPPKIVDDYINGNPLYLLQRRLVPKREK